MDQRAELSCQRPQIIEAVRCVLVCETIHTRQPNDKLVLDKEIGKIRSYQMAFVHNAKGRLSGSPNTTKG
jgi:hypothetical protein